MTPDWTDNGSPTFLATLEIDELLREPSAIVAGMLATGHAAISKIAAGAVWEDERDLAIAPDLEAHAERMALLWSRTARHLQCREPKPKRKPPPTPADPAQTSSPECRIDRQSS